MAEVVINTAFGPKNLSEAVVLFAAEQIGEGARLGIFNQLASNAPNQAREIAEKVMNSPGIYGPKIDKAVKTFIGGVGRKIQSAITPINSTQDILRVLLKLKVGDKLRLKFRQERTVGVTYLTGMNNHILQIDANDAVTVFAVSGSGQWGSETNRYATITALAGLFEPQGAAWFAVRLSRELESIKLLPI